jgi:hypothetical protein
MIERHTLTSQHRELLVTDHAARGPFSRCPKVMDRPVALCPELEWQVDVESQPQSFVITILGFP